MTRKRPQPAMAVPARPSLCRCSSASTSFMLAALRVLHVDSSHAPTEIARVKEQPFLTPATPAANQVSPTQPQSNRTTKRRRWLREE